MSFNLVNAAVVYLVFLGGCALLGLALGRIGERRSRKRRAIYAATVLDVLKPGWRERPDNLEANG